MKLLSSFFITIGLIISSISIFLLDNPAVAQQGGGRQVNDKYILHEGNFNYTSGKTSNSDFGLSFTGGELAQGLFTGANYTVRSGFQYYYSIIPFEFSISSLFVDFGPLIPGSPVTRTNRLILSNGSAFGYNVVAYENNALRVVSTGNDIPDTTCDLGTCSETTAAEWSQNTTYGFGYRCDNITGTECNSGFTTADYYKQFSNLEQSETPQSVMSGANVGRDFEAEIEYKVNVSSSQPAGLYQNQITYIATPSI